MLGAIVRLAMDFSKIYFLALVNRSELLIPSKSKYFVKTEPLWETNVVSEYAKPVDWRRQNFT